MTIINNEPFKPGKKVRLPKGTIIHSTHPTKKDYVLTRAQTITVRAVSHAHLDAGDQYGRGRGALVLPTVTWAGTGGYWRTAQITPAVYDANDMETPDLSDLEYQMRYVLRPTTKPSFDADGSNLWTVPAVA